MSALILDGRIARDQLIPELIKKIQALPFVPKLAIIQVGDRLDSIAFISAKKSFAGKIGVWEKHIRLSETISEAGLIKTIEECNADSSTQGIIVQLPLPSQIHTNTAIDTVDPRKDVDAITSARMDAWAQGKLIPATARGIRELLGQYGIKLQGKKVCVVGRSELVGKPIAVMCRSEGAEVVVCHSQTPDLAAETVKADVLIVAVGKPGLIQARHVKKGQIVIDVGINTISGQKLEDEIKGRKLIGDVDFNAVKDIVAAISPVPGGVGPMTVFGLFENLVDLCQN